MATEKEQKQNSAIDAAVIVSAVTLPEIHPQTEAEAVRSLEQAIDKAPGLTEAKRYQLKKNARYWAGRAAQLEALTNAGTVQTTKEVVRLYEEAIKRLQEQISVFYAKYADIDGVTYQEAKKILNASELQAFHMDVEEFVTKGKAASLHPEYIKDLERASVKVRLSRLEALQVHTRAIIEHLSQGAAEKTIAGMNVAYKDRFYHTVYGVQKYRGVGKPCDPISRKELDLLRVKPWAPDGYNFSERIWTNKAKLIETLNKEMTVGCITGKNLAEMSKRLAGIMETSAYNASRLIRTETAHFASLATEASYKECGVAEYQILATLDASTSEICQSMDGQIFKLSEYEEGMTAPPFHPNCRSTTIPVLDDDPDATRVARDAGGRTYEVPASMTYREWAETMIR